MSGILAVYRPDQTFNLERHHALLQLIRHRGPDGADTWMQPPVSLAACLLHTTPESLSEQPVTHAGAFHLVWDGRIDNRAELINELPQGRSLTHQTDPDLVLAAWQLWGPACLERILGDFAFILWDEKSRTLFAGRDRMGLKPLHYSWDGRSFAACSEIKPLLELSDRSPEPDEEMLLALLAYRNFIPADHTKSFFKGISRLAPGHFLSLQNGQLKIKCYWTPDTNKIIRHNRTEDYAAHFAGIFEKAVAARMRSLNPVFSFLSGGLDSSAITSLAASLLQSGKISAPDLMAVNLYSDAPASDERRYAREVAGRYNLRLFELFSRSAGPLSGLDSLIRKAESPLVSSSQDTEHYQLVRQQGGSVVLTGEGGDHVLDEFGFPADLLARLRLPELITKVRRFAADFSAPQGLFYKEAVTNVLPRPLLYLRRKMLRNVPPRWLNPAGQHKIAPRFFSAPPMPHFHSHAQASTYRDVTGAYSVLKWETEERIFGLHGIEPRFPFLDSRLVEFILAMPWQERATGTRKHILKKAAADFVPANILNRRDKGDWTQPSDSYLEQLCRQPAAEPLANRSGRMESYIDPAAMREMVRQYLGGKQELLRSELWFSITLDHWLGQFFRGEKRERIKTEQEKEISVPAAR